MSSVKPGKAYAPAGSLSAVPSAPALPGVGTIGTMNSRGSLPLANGGNGKSKTTEGPLPIVYAKKIAKVGKLGKK